MALDDEKPARKKPASKKTAKQGAKLPGATSIRAAAIVLGGCVTFLGVMSVFGALTSNLAGRVIGAIVVILVVPSLVAERMLKRSDGKGGATLVGNVFAIVLMVLALFFVGAEAVTRPLFTHEGDHYARSGSRGMARLLYFLGGATPTFPAAPAPAPAPSAGGSAGQGRP